MRAIIAHSSCSSGLQLSNVQKVAWPPFSSTKSFVLLRTVASGVNYADILQRKGKYPPPLGASNILGLEVSGIVEDVFLHKHDTTMDNEKTSILLHDFKPFKKGEALMALLPGGGYAEYVVAPVELCIRIPSGWEMNEGAAFMETYCTAYQNMFYEVYPCANHGSNFHYYSSVSVNRPKCVLIHSAAGGVGVAATQLAKKVGWETCSTCSPQKVWFCRDILASDHVISIDRAKQSDYFATKLIDSYSERHSGYARTEIEQGFVDHVLDPVFQSYLDDNIRVTARYGRHSVISFLSGTSFATSNTAYALKCMQKNITIAFSTLRNRPLEYQSNLIRSLSMFLGNDEKKTIRPYVQTRIPVKNAAEAHKLLEGGNVVGKIVLEW